MSRVRSNDNEREANRSLGSLPFLNNSNKNHLIWGSRLNQFVFCLWTTTAAMTMMMPVSAVISGNQSMRILQSHLNSSMGRVTLAAAEEMFIIILRS